ncbi:unnamed protein product [Allacma fusca]|uniref:Uncharacterized protein n=1 Tax=Allacma fusca TaxID=39272 RepID=A0A8J2PG83_9HEXA|nr:unnamed protein product [Allacma fusca]
MAFLVLITTILLTVFSTYGQECDVVNRLPILRYYVDELHTPGEAIKQVNRQVVGVTAVTVVYISGKVNNFFQAKLNENKTEVEISPTEELAKSFMNRCSKDCEYNPPSVEIHYKLKCGNQEHTIGPIFFFDVTDANNNPPQFEIGSVEYTLPLPLHGSPINWNQPIKVFDKDFQPENHRFALTSDHPDILLPMENPERVPPDSKLPLDHFNAFIRLADAFNQPGLHQVNPYINVEGYNQDLLENVPGEVVTVAKIGDGTDPTKSDYMLQTSIESNFPENLEILLNPIDNNEVEVALRQINAFTKEELGDNHLIKVTLVAKYETGHAKATVPIVLLYKRSGDVVVTCNCNCDCAVKPTYC